MVAFQRQSPTRRPAALSFDRARKSVFAVTPFIDSADFSTDLSATVMMAPAAAGDWPRPAAPARRARSVRLVPVPQPISTVPRIQWQSAVGTRLLTAAEEIARQRYFDLKAQGAMSRLRSRQEAI